MIIKESLNFERGIDPKASMHIGLGNVISKYMDDNENNNPFSWISYLAGAYPNFEWTYKLDKETRIKWINFLLSNPNKYIQKNSLDELDYGVFKRFGIHWIPYVPIADDEFKYIQEDEEYYLLFDGWENFSYYFEKDKNINEEFILNVLKGDAFEFFHYDIYKEYYQDLKPFIDFFKRNDILAYKLIKEKAIKLGANLNNLNSIEDMFTEINNNEKLLELKESILEALIDAQCIADESETFNILKNLIKKQYEIGDEEEYYEKIKVPISFNGLEKFSYTVATGEEKIILNLP